ncbi:MAG: hypothetical protein ACKO3W_00685, partial [bacterium]
TRARHIGSFDEIVEHLELNCRPGDLVVTMGAGPVNKIAKDFLRRGGAETTLTRAGEAAIPGFRAALSSGTSEAVA